MKLVEYSAERTIPSLYGYQIGLRVWRLVLSWDAPRCHECGRRDLRPRVDWPRYDWQRPVFAWAIKLGPVYAVWLRKQKEGID